MKQHSHSYSDIHCRVDLLQFPFQTSQLVCWYYNGIKPTSDVLQILCFQQFRKKTGISSSQPYYHTELSSFSPVTHLKSSVFLLPSRSQKPFRQLSNPIGENYGHCSSTCWRMPSLGGLLCALYICTVALALMYNAFTCLAKDITI